MRGWQGGRVEGGRDEWDMREGRPLPALHMSGRAQSSSSRYVELVATGDHLEELTVEEVLIHLLRGFCIADSHLLQFRMVGQ